jgi:hypothetical protein
MDNLLFYDAASTATRSDEAFRQLWSNSVMATDIFDGSLLDRDRWEGKEGPEGIARGGHKP